MTLFARVVVIVVLALLPAVGAELYNEHVQRVMQLADYRNDARHEALSVSTQLDRIITGVRNAMFVVAALPAIHDGDAATCGPLLTSLRRSFAFAGALALVGADGHRTCASNGETTVSEDLSNRPQIRLARERRGFVTAGYLVGRATQRPELSVALALDPAAGNASPVLVVDLDLVWLHNQLSALDELPGTSVVVADRNGIVLVRLPDAAVGQKLPAGELALMSLPSAGMMETTEPDGVPRTFGYVPLSPELHDLFVAVGISNQMANAQRLLALRRSLFLLAGGFALGLAGAVLLARYAVGRPVTAILTTIAAWRAGNTSARITRREAATNPDFAAISSALNDLLAAFARTRADLIERELTLTQRIAERTEQLEAEVREREQAQAFLQQAQKMEVIGQLTGGVAHDFNNLLTAIIGNLELARRRSLADATITRLLTNAMRAADRGAALTQRMLAFGRRQYLSLQPIATAELLTGMQDLLAPTIDVKIKVRLDLAADLWWIMGDRNQVELVVLNLAINARDAMPGGGSLVIAARNYTLLPSRTPHLAGLAPGEYVELTLSDTGSGMDEATLARVMEPFFTTKPVGKGSGLGLSMAQGVAAQSGGGLTIDSAPGVGTTVHVWLPRAASKPAVLADSPIGDDHGNVGNARAGAVILVVEDDPEVGDFAEQCLVDEGFVVIRAENGQLALAVIEQASRIDLMVADLAMPGMNGLQLAARTRELLPRLPILLATGYADADTFDGGQAKLPILEKPFKAHQLIAAVTGLLADVTG